MKPDWSKIGGLMPETSYDDYAGESAPALAVKRLTDSALEEIQFEQDLRDGAISLIKTGLTDLDKLVRGFLPQRMYVLAGRPSMGKSGLALSMAVSAAKQGHSVLFFSPDQSAGQLAVRILSDESGAFKYHDVQKHLAQAIDATSLIKDLRFYIDDTTLDINDMAMAADMMGADIMFIDYLQQLRPDDRYKGSRHNEISQISRALKQSAKSLEIPIVAISQLSRQVEQRTPEIPRMSDLKESGDIEQDADVIMLLYRAEFYLSKDLKEADQNERVRIEDKLQERRNTMKIFVDKNKQGPTGAVDIYCDMATNRFRDLV